MDKHTHQLHLPHKPFKKPNLRNQQTTVLCSQIELLMPNGEIITLPLDRPIELGRGGNESEEQVRVDLSLSGDGISRNHATIEFIDNKVCIQDNNSLNGTLLNGAELYPRRYYTLRNGDKLVLGKVKLQLRYVLV